MGLSLDGLVSGLDTTSLIKALMDVNSIPRNLLQSKMTDKGVIISNLQSLNASLQDIATKAKSALEPGAMARFATSSSASGVTVTAGKDAEPVTADIVVDAVAQRHSVVTAAYSSWPDDPPILTLQNSNGERMEITATSSSPQDVAKAITAAGFGITAHAVSAGTDAEGEPLYRLQLTATEPGADVSASEYTVWMESITATSGLCSARVARIFSSWISACSCSSRASTASRLARRAICEPDSSPLT